MKKLILLVLLISFPVQAAGLKYIPKWTMCGDSACYSFEQAKKLVEIDQTLDLLYGRLDLQTGVIDDLHVANANLTQAVESLEGDVELLKTENTQLTDQLKQAIKDKNDAIADSSSFSFGWVIAGAAICIAGGLAFAVASK